MEKKTGKYFKYAIGEIILVVIGILIALQINNWNENRKENIKAKSYLINIKEDLKKDTTLFNKALSDLKFKTVPNTEMLLGMEDFRTYNYDSLVNLLPIIYYEYTINTQTFDKLINSGITELGGDVKLFDDINNYYTNVSNNYYSVRNWDITQTNKDSDFFFNNSFEIPNDIIIHRGVKKNFFSVQTLEESKSAFSKVMLSVEARNKLKSSYYRKSRLMSTFTDTKKAATDLLNKINKKSND